MKNLPLNLLLGRGVHSLVVAKDLKIYFSYSLLLMIWKKDFGWDNPHLTVDPVKPTQSYLIISYNVKSVLDLECRHRSFLIVNYAPGTLKK